VSRQALQGSDRIVREQRDVLLADVLMPRVFAARLSNASLVVDQCRIPLACETLGPITENGLERIEYRQTEHYIVAKRLLNDPEGQLDRLLR